MTSLHAMETVSLVEMTKTSLSLMYNGTKINLIKGYWEDAIDTIDAIDLTIVGKQQQRVLKKEYDHYGTVGETYWSYGAFHYIYKRKKEDDSASDDDTYKPHRQIDNPTWRDEQIAKKSTMHIEEPCIRNSTQTKPAQCPNTFVYNCIRAMPNNYYRFDRLCFQGDEAIPEASKDLS